MNTKYRKYTSTVPNQLSDERLSYNIIRDWNELQGMTHPSDSYVQPLRSVNSRYVNIQNSGYRPISIAITLSMGGPETPNPLLTIPPGQTVHLGLNDVTGPSQFIHLLDPNTKKPVGTTTCIRRDKNTLVLRDGLQQWFVQFFHQPVYRG